MNQLFSSSYFTENASHVIKNGTSSGLMPRLKAEITNKNNLMANSNLRLNINYNNSHAYYYNNSSNTFSNVLSSKRSSKSKSTLISPLRVEHEI